MEEKLNFYTKSFGSPIPTNLFTTPSDILKISKTSPRSTVKTVKKHRYKFISNIIYLETTYYIIYKVCIKKEQIRNRPLLHETPHSLYKFVY